MNDELKSSHIDIIEGRLIGVASKFSSVAKNFHEKIAVVSQDSQLSYAELDILSEQVASYISDEGILPGDCVGICGPTEIRTIVLMLGIIKAGAHYVYLNENDPFSLRFEIAQTTRLKLVLSSRDQLPSSKSEPLKSQRQIPNINQGNLPAYAIFSSGSTGVPKVILCSQKSLANICTNQWFVQLDSNTVSVLHSPLSFDASVYEIWAPLLNGGTCIIHRQTILESADIRKYSSSAARVRLNTLWISATYFNILVELDPTVFADVRFVLTGGDTMSPKHIKMAFTSCPSTIFINGYGPTENTIFSTCHIVTENDFNNPAIPIGKPVTGVQTMIVDSNLEAVEGAEKGELLLLGAGASLGYLNNAALNRERFVTVNFKGINRLAYRSGDICSQNANGTIFYWGRQDEQIKVNGFRVETSQMGHQIKAIKGVKDVHIFTINTFLAKQLVIAMAVDEKIFLIQSVKDFIKSNWPEFLHPAQYFLLPEFPILNNGKLDRKELISRFEKNNQLPIAIPWEKIDDSIKNQLGISIIEKIAGLCVKYFDQGSIVGTSYFLGQGGSSLIAVRFLAEMSKNKFSIKMKDLAEHRSFLSLLGCLSMRSSLLENSDHIDLDIEGTQNTLSPYQSSIALSEILNYENKANSMFYILPNLQSYSESHLQDLARAIVANYPILNSTIDFSSDGFYFQCKPQSQSFVLIDNSNYPNEELMAQKYIEFHRSLFESEKFLFISANCDSARTVGLWMHHIIADSAFVEDLLQFIENHRLGMRPNIPPVRKSLHANSFLHKAIKVREPEDKRFWESNLFPTTLPLGHSWYVVQSDDQLTTVRSQLLNAGKINAFVINHKGEHVSALINTSWIDSLDLKQNGA